MNHSPTPFYQDKSNKVIRDRNGEQIAFIFSTFDEETFVLREDLHIANMNLFAAAPELLALLIEVVSELSDTDDEGLIEHTEWMMKARATIAKAKGE